VAADESPALEMIQEYLDFAEYSDGAITPEQIIAIGSNNFQFVDARDQKRFDAGHIPGAINVEWRQILERQSEIPRNKSVILYCDTGLSSSKAYFILRLAGYENINVLRGGYTLWKRRK
jgi:rhodanese-related sulfurtransferase